jgi:penicillin-binding protein 1A
MANGTFGGNRPAKPQRTPLQALLYWTVVLGVWA